MYNYQHTLPAPRTPRNKNTGFTLIEILVAGFILMIILGALFSALNIGDLSNTIGGAKLDVQQEVMIAMDWMVKDLRQTSRNKLVVTDIDGNNTSFSGLGGNNTVFTQPRFYLCTGYNPATSTINWSTNMTGYDFDAVNQTIIRTDLVSGHQLQFNRITNLTFMKVDRDSLSINITAQKVARGNAATTANLLTEVNLRNE